MNNFTIHHHRRRKTTSDDSLPHNPPVKLQKHYSSLTQQSIHKDYNITELRPFSDNQKITQIQSQLSHLKVVVPQKNSICLGKNTIMQKMETIISTSRIKDYKKKKHKFVKSLIHNDQKTLIEDYKQELKTDKKIKHQIIDSINRKLLQHYPSSVDSQSKKDTILSFKKDKKVTQLYLPQEHDEFKRVYTQQQISCRKWKKKKTLKTMGDKQKYTSVKVIGKEGKYSKVYYESYLCSYKGRKSLLNSIIS